MSAMSQSGAVVWKGRPWITPVAVARTVLVVGLGVVVVWLEGLVSAASFIVIGVPIWVWTILAFLVVWLVSLVPLLVLRAGHQYTLRGSSLEVKTGIASLQSFVLSPSGFSDLEINHSVIGRIANYGDVIVHTQSDRTAKMQKVRDPNRVAGLIRDYMGRPIVRVEGQAPADSK